MSKNQRLNASITIGSVLEQSVKKNIGFLKSGLNSVGSEIKDVERKQRELGRQRKVLIKQGQSVAALDREYEKLEKQLKDLKHAQERWNRAAAASRRVGSTFSTMASDIVRKSRAIAIGVGLAGGAVFGLASSTAKLGDDVAKTADKLGIGIQELQELRYAAERSGVATGAFDSSLEKMTKNIGLALEGTGAQKDALDALGLSADDLSTMLPEKALGLIADRMQGVATQAEKAAIANDIFGRSGIGMLNMLRDGSSGLRDLRDDARRTGYVLSEQAARDAEVFQDTLLDTQLIMKGLKNTVGAELMPVVTQSMRRVGNALVDNREQVKVWATSFADGVERALPVIGEVAVGIGNVLTITGRVVSTTADMVGGWENFGMIIGAVLASRTVIRIGKFGMAVFSLGKAMVSLAASTPLVVGGIKAIGTALMMNPIGLAVAAIAGGAYLIYRNWEAVGPWFKGLWGDVKTYFGGAADFVGGVFTGDMERAGRGLTTIWEGYKGIMDRVVGGIGSVFKATWMNAIKPVTDALGITEPIKSAWEAVKTSLGSVIDWLAEKFEWLGGLIAPIIDKLVWVKEKGGAVLSAIGLGGDNNTKQVANPMPQGVGTNRRYALGGAFPMGGILVGENGPELRYENRAGFIAHNRSMRQMASYADRVGSMAPQARGLGRTVDARLSRAQQLLRTNRNGPQGATQALSAMSARIEAALGGGVPQPAVVATSGEVTQNITNHFHASGVSADELMSIAERKRRTQVQGALFDRAPVSGPFGR